MCASSDCVNYKGIIIEESLKDKSLIKKLKVLSSSIDGAWHLYTVEVSEKEIEEISHSLNAQKWYAHFWNNQKVIVAFKDKLMNF